MFENIPKLTAEELRCLHTNDRSGTQYDGSDWQRFEPRYLDNNGKIFSYEMIIARRGTDIKHIFEYFYDTGSGEIVPQGDMDYIFYRQVYHGTT